MSYLFTGTGTIKTANTNANNYIDVNDHSWACWVYTTVQPAGLIYFALNSANIASSYTRSLLQTVPTTSGWQFAFDQVATSVSCSFTYTTDLALNTWIHVGYDGNGLLDTTPNVYINGAAVTATRNSTPSGTRVGGEAAMLFGEDTTGGEAFKGKLAELGFWTRRLSVQEWAALGAGEAPSMFPTGLSYYFPFLNDANDGMSNSGVITVTNATLDGGHPTMLYPNTKASLFNLGDSVATSAIIGTY